MTFYFNLESLVLPDSHVHPSYTSSSRPIFGPSRFEFNGVSSSARGSVARTIEASRDNRRLNTDSDSLVSYYNEQGCTPFQSIMPEISTGCLLSVMFVDIIRASIHDRDSQQGDHGSERRRFFGPEGYVLNDQAIQERVLYLRMCILQHCSFAQDDLRYRMICLYSHIRYRIGP